MTVDIKPDSKTRGSNISLLNQVMSEPWDYVDADTQYLTHNIHRYSGKFIPQIPSRVIQSITDPGDIVFDPYCGSGTTLVEAALLGRKSYGVDLSPLAVLISKVKTTPIASALLEDLCDSIASALMTYKAEERLPLLSFSEAQGDLEKQVASDRRNEDEWYTKWFQPEVLEDLLAIDILISSLSDLDCQDVARVAFSDVLRKSSNAHSGYPNVMFDKKAPVKASPIEPFLKNLRHISSLVLTLSSVDADWNSVKVDICDNTELQLSDESIDAVVSHPPYIGSIPYAEYGLLSLKWLGADPKMLDRTLTGGRRQTKDVVERFEAGYESMMKEALRVLRTGRSMFLMVGNPVVRGEKIRLDVMTEKLAEKVGFNLWAKTTRTGSNRRANKMGHEYLLFFEKP